jgi:hypothetical protein
VAVWGVTLGVTGVTLFGDTGVTLCGETGVIVLGETGVIDPPLIGVIVPPLMGVIVPPPPPLIGVIVLPPPVIGVIVACGAAPAAKEPVVGKVGGVTVCVIVMGVCGVCGVKGVCGVSGVITLVVGGCVWVGHRRLCGTVQSSGWIECGMVQSCGWMVWGIVHRTCRMLCGTVPRVACGAAPPPPARVAGQVGHMAGRRVGTHSGEAVFMSISRLPLLMSLVGSSSLVGAAADDLFDVE